MRFFLLLFSLQYLPCSAPPHCEYTDSPGRYLPVADKFLPRTYAVEDCRRGCDTEPEFQCRAFSFHAHRRECLLSSDDTHSSGQVLIPDPDFFYGERGACNNGMSFVRMNRLSALLHRIIIINTTSIFGRSC